MKRFFLASVAGLMATAAVNAQHYQLGPEWVTGEGVYVIAEEDGNRYLVGAAVNNADPKHAWVNQDFGDTYTVRCDVRMDSWVNEEDLSRAGIAAQITPDGTAPDGDGDRGINLLFHDTTSNIEFLNDLRAWADDTAFEWSTGTWYTFELTITDGITASGSVTNVDDPADSVELVPWDFPDPQNRFGFAGITPSTLGGLMASYDNFEVEVDGSVVFSDDFEGTNPISSTVGLGSEWVAGQAGYYVVDDGTLFAIATSGADPKHAWFGQEIIGGAQISADVSMLSWVDGEDLSRAGVAVHIQPDGTAPDGGGDRGINLLFHDNLNNIEYLNDLRAWATDEAFAWEVGTVYRFNLASDGTTVTGSVDDFELAPWDFPDPQNRQNGFAGITPSTLRGLIAGFDNVEIRDGSGNVIFADNFEAFQTSNVNTWELFK